MIDTFTHTWAFPHVYHTGGGQVLRLNFYLLITPVVSGVIKVGDF